MIEFLGTVCFTLPNIKMHAIKRTIHDRLSHGITSAPVKYSPRLIGQHSVALISPSIVNVNATIGTGGSPIILRNMTCHTFWHWKNISKIEM